MTPCCSGDGEQDVLQVDMLFVLSQKRKHILYIFICYWHCQNESLPYVTYSFDVIQAVVNKKTFEMCSMHAVSWHFRHRIHSFIMVMCLTNAGIRAYQTYLVVVLAQGRWSGT